METIGEGFTKRNWNRFKFGRIPGILIGIAVLGYIVSKGSIAIENGSSNGKRVTLTRKLNHLNGTCQGSKEIQGVAIDDRVVSYVPSKLWHINSSWRIRVDCYQRWWDDFRPRSDSDLKWIHDHEGVLPPVVSYQVQLKVVDRCVADGRKCWIVVLEPISKSATDLFGKYMFRYIISEDDGVMRSFEMRRNSDSPKDSPSWGVAAEISDIAHVDVTEPRSNSIVNFEFFPLVTKAETTTMVYLEESSKTLTMNVNSAGDNQTVDYRMHYTDHVKTRFNDFVRCDLRVDQKWKGESQWWTQYDSYENDHHALHAELIEAQTMQ